MTDQPFREIQLSGKQLFFLFMASVVFMVAVFLLGVSVGRGVRNAAGASVDVAAAGDTTVPATMPPPTETKPGELTYHDQLQGQPPAGAAPKTGEPPPTPPAETPAVTGGAAGAAAGAAAKGAGTKPPDASPSTPKSGAPPASKPPADKTPAKATEPPPPPAGSWLIQTGAFGSRPNAEKMASDLRAKGFAAFVDSNGPARSQFRARVGPFKSRAEADQAAAKLKQQGVSASVLR